MSSLPSLASPDDIVARLGRNLNQVEMARVDALLRDGSAIIRAYCNKVTFEWYPEDTIIVVSDRGTIVLPWRPVESIASVTAISGLPSIPDIPVTWYSFDGIDTLIVPGPRDSGVINLPEYWYETSWWSNSFQVTGAHGYEDIPDEAVAVLCTAIISELSTPTMSATLASESIGPYSYSMRRTSGAGLKAALEDAGMKSVLYEYHKSQGTLAVRI